MKGSYVAGIVIGGLAVGGALLLASDERKSSYKTDLILLKENLEKQIASLKEEVNELIEIGQATAYKFEGYIQERIPTLYAKIEALKEEASDLFSELKETLDKLANVLVDLWKRSTSYISCLLNGQCEQE